MVRVLDISGSFFDSFNTLAAACSSRMHVIAFSMVFHVEWCFWLLLRRCVDVLADNSACLYTNLRGYYIYNTVFLCLYVESQAVTGAPSSLTLIGGYTALSISNTWR